ncbi:unknown [Firmicutes bacterium CAG:822]|nr:unknown [Firmicutes bacterium CAG:822]
MGDIMLKDLRTYILENEFKINILIGKIDIVNYIEIDHFDDTKIMVRYEKGLVVIKGENLTISKLLNDELLILGKIKSFEFK